MEIKRKILSLIISAALTAGLAGYPMSGYSDSDKSKSSDDSDKSKSSDDSDKSKSSDDSDKSNNSSNKADVSDGDERKANGDASPAKITICHVPPGNPANKHTIHIAFSAWAAHRAHTNNIGPDYADYLGSCNSKTTSTSKEALHVISGCSGTYRTTLATKVQSYFEPITVADTTLDDQNIVTAMSQCLDKGDSSDSGNGKADNRKSLTGGKGRGHDSVSDSGNHHRIRGCQNKDADHKADSSKQGVSDSDRDDANKNYHKKLKDFDAAKGLQDPVIVTDSSLNDSGVWTAYKSCAGDANGANKINSSMIGNKKGDSGHKHHILKSCGTAKDQALRDAIATYKSKASTKDIVLTETSLTDASIKQAVQDCTDPNKGQGSETVTNSFVSTGVSGRVNFREVPSPIKN